MGDVSGVPIAHKPLGVVEEAGADSRRRRRDGFSENREFARLDTSIQQAVLSRLSPLH